MTFPKKGLGRGLGDLINQTSVPVSLRPNAFALNKTERVAPVVATVSENVEASKSEELPIAPLAPVESGNLAIEVAPAPIRQAPPGGVVFLAIEKIIPHPTQPRQTFDEKELQELAQSIKTRGVLQPILVRPAKGSVGLFEIVAGERRWRASKLAGVLEIPVMLRELSDLECLEVALIENVQRQNLNVVDEAQAYQRLIDEHQLNQEEVADRVGKERSTVANYVRLLKLHPAVLKLLREDKISMGHAKAILPVKDAPAQQSLAKKVVEEGLSVRALEALVSTAVVLDGQREAALRGKDYTISGKRTNSVIAFPEIVDRLRNFLGTKVAIRHSRRGKGKLEVEYFSEQELERVVELILKDR